ncbi:hypothetical protein Tco_1266838 [Tanacetum coccineum]
MLDLVPDLLRRLTSSNLNGTTVQELHQLEQQLNDGLISVKEKKDAMDVHKTLRPFVLTSAVEKGFERAMLAVSQRWPVLLHGRVGASKTALISRLAQSHGRQAFFYGI